MKTFISIAIASIAFAALGACSALSATPSDAQVTAIKSACIADGVLRPTVDVLATLETPAEAVAITDARKIIDQVCANPAASVEANTLAIFSESTAQVANIVAQLQARKKAVTPAPAASSAT